MSTKKQGALTTHEDNRGYVKHLRPFWKRKFWKRERKTVAREIVID